MVFFPVKFMLLRVKETFATFITMILEKQCRARFKSRKINIYAILFLTFVVPSAEFEVGVPDHIFTYFKFTKKF
jgi:hypothetical protein